MSVSNDQLAESLRVLHVWAGRVPQQTIPHVFSFLPVKLAGAMPGETITYREDDDRVFLDRFCRYGPENDPYFDPFRHRWLRAGYWHSNISTYRKKTFERSWAACQWEQSELFTLGVDYAEKVERHVLTKAGVTTRLPAAAMATWFFKRPSAEWPGDEDAAAVEGAEARVALFRRRFNFDDDPGWATIFDPDPSALGEAIA